MPASPKEWDMDSDQIHVAYKKAQTVEDTGTGIVGLIITLRRERGTDKVNSLVVMGQIPDPVLPLDAGQLTQAERKFATIWPDQFGRLKLVRPPIDTNPFT
jgi:hypothetical protein